LICIEDIESPAIVVNANMRPFVPPLSPALSSLLGSIDIAQIVSDRQTQQKGIFTMRGNNMEHDSVHRLQPDFKSGEEKELRADGERCREFNILKFQPDLPASNE
jgi:hypothetical protein